VALALRDWLETASVVLIPVIVMIVGNEVAKSNATREVEAKTL